MQTVGARVKFHFERLKRSQNMTQEKLAKAINVLRPDLRVKQQSLDQLMKDEVTRPRYMAPLAQVLGVDQHWLETGEGDMYPPVPVLGRAGASHAASRHRGFVKQALELFQQLDPGQQSTILQLMRGLVRGGNG